MTEVNSSGPMASTTSISDDIALLNGEGEETPVEEETPVVEEEVPTEEEIPDVEEEAEGEEPEDQEEESKTNKETESKISFEEHPFKALNAAHKGIFQEFPGLRDALKAGLDYSKVYPTVEDAKEAAVKSQVFDQMDRTLMEGKAEPLLTAVLGANKGAAAKLARDFIPTLFKLDKGLFEEATQPIVKALLRHSITEGTRLGNENLVKSARNLTYFLFNSQEVPEDAPVDRTSEISGKEKELVERERQFAQRQYQTFESNISSNAKSRVLAKIETELDPNKALPAYMKQNVIANIMYDLSKELESDQNHMQAMANLWQRAGQKGFNGADAQVILNTYLNRVNKSLPAIRQRHLTQAMKDLGKPISVAQATKRVANTTTGGTKIAPIKSGIPKPGTKQFYNQFSDEDILNGKHRAK